MNQKKAKALRQAVRAETVGLPLVKYVRQGKYGPIRLSGCTRAVYQVAKRISRSN